MITYLNMRFKFPKTRSAAILKKIDKLKYAPVLNMWNTYIEFRKQNTQYRCKSEDYVENMETYTCLKKDSKRLRMFEINTIIKACENGKVYNILNGKCIDEKKMIDINIQMDEVLKVTGLDKNNKFRHLGNNNQTVVPSVLFILRKHNNAFLITNQTTARSFTKDNFAIQWNWNTNTKMFDLILPTNFWNVWKEGMMGPWRFLIILVSLNASFNADNQNARQGKHANVLIYDKTKNEIERFDGQGKNIDERFGLDEFDTHIKEMFQKEEGHAVPQKIKYFSPIDYCPRKLDIFQQKEMEGLVFSDNRGNCAIWRLWYIDTRLANPHLSRDKVVKYAMVKLDNYGLFNRFIKLYQAYVTKAMNLSAHTPDLSLSLPTD